MKKSELKFMIREIVREEVALSIKAVVNELTQPTQSSQTQPVVEKKTNKNKSFTKNSILNEVMNETASEEEWKTMGGGTYDSGKMNQVVSSQYGDLMQQSSQPNPDAMVATLGVNPAQVSDKIKDNLFNKDYSSVLKKIDEKVKKSRGV